MRIAFLKHDYNFKAEECLVVENAKIIPNVGDYIEIKNIKYKVSKRIFKTFNGQIDEIKIYIDYNHL